MPVLFTCPQCGLETNVDDQYLGMEGPCAGCGTAIHIPSQDDLKDSSKSQLRSVSRASAVIAGVIVLCTVTVVMLIWLAMPLISSTRSAVHVGQCGSNLKLIHAAIEAYRQEKGHYPPAYVADDTGKPLYSWRVLILPYLDDEAAVIARNFDLNAAWDSPQNAAVIKRIPSVFVCPADPEFDTGNTSYMAVSGKGFLFDGAQKTTPDQIKDGIKSTLLFIEVSKSGVHWAEPGDINIDQLSQGINNINGGIGSGHRLGVHAVMADGKVVYLPDFYSPEDLEKMCTINGGELVEFPDMDGVP